MVYYFAMKSKEKPQEEYLQSNIKPVFVILAVLSLIGLIFGVYMLRDYDLSKNPLDRIGEAVEDFSDSLENSIEEGEDTLNSLDFEREYNSSHDFDSESDINIESLSGTALSIVSDGDGKILTCSSKSSDDEALLYIPEGIETEADSFTSCWFIDFVSTQSLSYMSYTSSSLDGTAIPILDEFELIDEELRIVRVSEPLPNKPYRYSYYDLLDRSECIPSSYVTACKSTQLTFGTAYAKFTADLDQEVSQEVRNDDLSKFDMMVVESVKRQQ